MIIQQAGLQDSDYIQALNILFTVCALVFDVILLVILKNLRNKWESTSEKSQLKSGKAISSTTKKVKYI